MLLSICLVIMSLHFARVLAGNLYRALPAFLTSKAQLAQMLGKTTVMKVPAKNAAGEATGEWEEETVSNPEAITVLERVKFYGHILLAS